MPLITDAWLVARYRTVSPLARNQAGRTTESTAATTLATGIPCIDRQRVFRWSERRHRSGGIALVARLDLAQKAARVTFNPLSFNCL